MLNRQDYWQCAFVIPKGGFDRIRQEGLAAFRGEIARLVPYLGDRVGELGDWSDIKLLTVAVDRLRVWHRPGLLCIGDAAHAMSPIGGVGINLAIQDAVAAANILAPCLLNGTVGEADLHAGPAPPRVPYPRDAAAPAIGPEPGDRARSPEHARTGAATPATAPRTVAVAAPHSGAPARPRVSPGAYQAAAV